MIDTDHTEGPWRTGSTIAGYTAIEAPDEDEPVAWADFRKKSDLRLVIAAPDMLQSLMEFVSMFPCVPGSIGDEIRQKARAAIAKACGVAVEELGAR